MSSLTDAQRRGLLRLGDVIIPGDPEHGLPSFSQAGVADEIDRMLPWMYDSDRSAILMLLTTFATMPRPAIRAIVLATEKGDKAPGPLGSGLRMASVGVKGLVLSLYYSGVDAAGAVHRGIGWDATITMHPEEPDRSLPRTRSGTPSPDRGPTDPVPTDPVPTDPAATDESERPAWAPLPTPDLSADGAVERARAASGSLTALTIAERVDHLARLRRAVLARREEIIDAVQSDTGKSRSDILVSEIFGALDVVLWCEKNAESALADEKVPTPLTMMGKKSLISYEPLGVMLVISPWNYPFYQAIAPIALNLAAGNTVVYKPSEHTPLTGLVESVLEDASIAPGWVQVIYGDGAVGADLLAQGPDKVMFTGSTATGKKIMAAAAEQLIPVELELGGKDAMIVFEDVDLDRAVAGALWGGLTATGQSCTSVERLYVHASIHDRFVEALAAGARAIKQEVDSDGDSDIGAMITRAQVEVVAEHVADAEAKGATLVTGGEWDRESSLVPPIVLTGISDDATIATAETFGPVLPVYPFTTEAEVVARANDSAFGLTASVWSKDADRALRVARALRVGGVSINNVMATESTPALPFGGVKQSGMGRYKGAHGLRSFCNAKSVVIDKDSDVIEANWFPYTKKKYGMFVAMMEAWFSDGPTRLPRFGVLGTRLEGYAKKARR